MKKNNNDFNRLIKSAINYNALKQAMDNPKTRKELEKIFKKVRY